MVSGDLGHGRRRPDATDVAVTHSRRAALAKLGLGAAAIYIAPTVTRIDQARAQAPSHGCPPGAPGCSGSHPGRGPGGSGPPGGGPPGSGPPGNVPGNMPGG